VTAQPPIKVYVITFTAVGVNLASLIRYLHDSADIIAYWNYVPLVFCVKTRLDSMPLTYKLQPFFPSNNFFIAEIVPSNVNGMLPQPAWEWFYLPHHEKHQPPAYANALLPFLKP